MATYASSSQGFIVAQGEAGIFEFAPDPTVADKDITNWTLAFVVRSVLSASSGAAFLTKTLANGGITLISAVDGTWKATLTNANTMALPVGLYDWEAWRINSGAETKLAFGKLEVVRSVQYPV